MMKYKKNLQISSANIAMHQKILEKLKVKVKQGFGTESEVEFVEVKLKFAQVNHNVA